MSKSSSSVPLEQLLAHRTWVAALARALTGNEHDAADLEQDVWMTALDRRPDDVGSVRGWLRRVLTNRAISSHRSRERREARELRSERPTSSPPTHDLVARAETHRRVVDAVLALDEPYRSTVLARYFDGLPPRYIAERDGVPVATVNTRLTRARTRLRGVLTPDGDPRRLAALLVPLTLDAPPPPVTASPWGGVLVSIGIRKVVAAAALLALLVTAGSAVLLRADPTGGDLARGDDVATATDVDPSRRIRDRSRDRQPIPPESGSGASDASAESTSDARRPEQTGPEPAEKVVDLSTGVAFRVSLPGADESPSVRVQVRTLQGSFRNVRVEALEDGRLFVPDLPEGPHRVAILPIVRAEERGFLPHVSEAIERGGELPPVLLDPGCGVTGTVTDESGAFVAGARVHGWVQPSGGIGQLQVVATADDRGRFRLIGLPAGQQTIYARAPSATHPRLRGASIEVETTPTGAVDRVRIELPGGTAWAGVVDLPAGLESTPTLVARRVGGAGSTHRAMLRDGGSFRLAGLPDGEYLLSLDWTPGTRNAVILRDPGPYSASELPGRLSTEPSAHVSGRVVTADGAPVVQALVQVSVPARGWQLRVYTGNGSTFTVHGLRPDDEVTIHAIASSYVCPASVTARAGATDVAVRCSRTWTLDARVLGADGDPVEGARVLLAPVAPWPGESRSEGTTNLDGYARFKRLRVDAIYTVTAVVGRRRVELGDAHGPEREWVFRLPPE